MLKLHIIVKTIIIQGKIEKMKFIILLSTLLLLSACNNAEIIEDADVQTNINIEEN